VPPWKVLVLVAGGNGVSEPGVRWGNLSVGRRARGMLTDRYGTVLVGYCVRVGFLDSCEVQCGAVGDGEKFPFPPSSPRLACL